MSKVFEDISKKVKCNFYDLVCLLAETINLRMIGYIIKNLIPSLVNSKVKNLLRNFELPSIINSLDKSN